MIFISEYFNNKTGTVEQKDSAQILLVYVNGLIFEYMKDTQKQMPINPKTGNLISGSKDGDGGFRLADTKTGAKLSSHKTGKGVDIFDPLNQFDDWLTDEILTRNYLYREHPSATKNWVHLTTRIPSSKNRTFLP